MALTKISTGGVKDDAASQAKIADEAIDEARLQVSNAGSNGQFLQKQSGNTGGLTWATPPDTQVGGATGVDFNDDVKARWGTGNDLEIKHDGTNNYIDAQGGHLYIQCGGSNDDSNVYIRARDGEDSIVCHDDGTVELYYDNSKKIETTTTGVTVTGTCTATQVVDSKGNVRDIPQNTQTSAYTLAGTDAGKHIYISSGGVTVPASVYGAGNAVTIINNSDSDQTITQGSGMTMYNTSDGTTGNRTLGGRGMATILFINSSAGYISGAGLT